MDRQQLSHEMIKLSLYARHNVVFYDHAYKVLGKFHRAGTYNLDRAIKYLDRYCLLPAAKHYKLEFGSMTDSVSQLFPRSERLKLAEVLALEMVGEFKLGNY